MFIALHSTDNKVNLKRSWLDVAGPNKRRQSCIRSTVWEKEGCLQQSIIHHPSCLSTRTLMMFDVRLLCYHFLFKPHLIEEILAWRSVLNWTASQIQAHALKNKQHSTANNNIARPFLALLIYANRVPLKSTITLEIELWVMTLSSCYCFEG